MNGHKGGKAAAKEGDGEVFRGAYAAARRREVGGGKPNCGSALLEVGLVDCGASVYHLGGG